MTELSCQQARQAVAAPTEAPREALLHVAGCAACQQQLARLERVDQGLQASSAAGHPDNHTLLELALDAPAGAPAQQAALQAHLDSCPGCQALLAGARAGLAEARQLEQGGTRRQAVQLWWPPQPRLMAASGAGEQDPPPDAVPRHRRQLPGAPEGVVVELYLRHGQAVVAVIVPDIASQQLSCTLDHQPLTPSYQDHEGVEFELGHPDQLAGRTLHVGLVTGEGPVELSWALYGPQ